MDEKRLRLRVTSDVTARVTFEDEEKTSYTVPRGIIPSSIRDDLHKESIVYADVRDGQKGPLINNFSKD